jgi:hypothetical protein
MNEVVICLLVLGLIVGSVILLAFYFGPTPCESQEYTITSEKDLVGYDVRFPLPSSDLKSLRVVVGDEVYMCIDYTGRSFDPERKDPCIIVGDTLWVRMNLTEGNTTCFLYYGDCGGIKEGCR